MRIDNGGRGFKHGSGPLNTRNDTKNFEAEIIKPFVCLVCFVGTRGQKTAERMIGPRITQIHANGFAAVKSLNR
jgi:hypothetical protein